MYKRGLYGLNDKSHSIGMKIDMHVNNI